MVEAVVVDELEEGAHGTGFRVVAAVDDAVQAAVDDGAGTHGARFDGHVEGTACQAPAIEGAAGFFNGQQFGVGRRTGQAFAQVIGPGDNFLFIDDDGADRDFSDGIGRLGFGQGFAHIKFIFSHSGWSLLSKKIYVYHNTKTGKGKLLWMPFGGRFSTY